MGSNPPPAGGIPPRDNLNELLTFLTEESERNRRAIWDQTEANRAALNHQADADRKLFRTTAWIVAAPLTVVLAIAGYFGGKDITAIEDKAEATMNAAVEQNKAAIAVEQEKNAEALEKIRQDAAATVQSEIDKADKTLEAKFSDENIQNTINSAAKTATEGKARAIIETRVHNMIAPLEAQAKASVEAIRVQELIAGANADNASNFDQLLVMQDKGTPSQQALVKGVIANLEQSKAIRTAPYTFSPIPASDLSAFLKDTTKSAPQWVNSALANSSLSGRAAAYSAIDNQFGNTPGFPPGGLDITRARQLREWWQSHGSDPEMLVRESVGLALLSYAAGIQEPTIPENLRQNEFDQTKLYDDLDLLETPAIPSLAPRLTALRDQMRSAAAKLNVPTGPSPYFAWMGHGTPATCETIGGQMIEVLPYYLKEPDRELKDDGNLLTEPDFLAQQNCPLQPKLEPLIAGYAIKTQWLSRRYALIALIDKWRGINLDPYDAAAFSAWWDMQQKTQVQ